VAAGGSVLLFLGLFPVLGRVVAAVPLPVLGGAGIVLFGSVAASGIRTLSKVSFDGNLNLVIVAVAIGFGVIPIAVPGFYAAFPEWVHVIFDSGISAANIVAVLLNIFFNVFTRGHKTSPSVVTAAPPRRHQTSFGLTECTLSSGIGEKPSISDDSVQPGPAGPSLMPRKTRDLPLGGIV
jgi:uric acid transporter